MKYILIFCLFLSSYSILRVRKKIISKREIISDISLKPYLNKIFHIHGYKFKQENVLQNIQ